MIETLSMIDEWLVSMGAKPEHKRRIYRAWLGRGEWPDMNAQRIPKAVRLAVPEIRARLQAIATLKSEYPGYDEQSARLLLTLNDEKTVESVLLPRDGICVSSQIGCAVGCVFCMTGRDGLIRQLSDAEIVAQVAMARRLRPQSKKVVFMGMGEPSHNLKNVIAAVEFLAEYGDFGHKNLVVSTVGDRRLFDAFENMDVRVALAVSLHTVDDEKRRQLLPRGCRMSVDELIDASEKWARKTGYPTQYEWTLMEGVNNALSEAQVLAKKLQGKYAMVNFIPVNAVQGSPFKRPGREEAADMVRTLRRYGVIATLRYSAAQEVDGGCGQLRARVLREEGRCE